MPRFAKGVTAEYGISNQFQMTNGILGCRNAEDPKPFPLLAAAVVEQCPFLPHMMECTGWDIFFNSFNSITSD